MGSVVTLAVVLLVLTGSVRGAIGCGCEATVSVEGGSAMGGSMAEVRATFRWGARMFLLGLLTTKSGVAAVLLNPLAIVHPVPTSVAQHHCCKDFIVGSGSFIA